MKTAHAAILCLLLLLVSGCAQKINDPADVQAVKKSVEDFAKAVNAGDSAGVAAVMTEKTVYADPNVPVAVGADAIRTLWLPLFEQFKMEFNVPVEDVRVTGDNAVARGTWSLKFTPKSQGAAGLSDSGSWMATLARQNGGAWKWEALVANSNQPLPGTTPGRVEENALIQIEQDWAKALEKSDATGFEKYLAKEYTFTSDGQTASRAQMLAELRGGAYKIESAQMTELNPHVFGDVALVTMTAVIKGKYKGADFPSPVRSTDFFVKRDGRWQAVSTQNVTIK
jgi:uncharacterized protein (TIGR02246 family)